MGVWVFGYFLIALATAALAEETPPAPANDDAARQMATINGKYKNLLHKIHVPSDQGKYSAEEVHDYGWWTGESYGGASNLQHGYWVWVDPHWYIFSQSGETPLHFAVAHGHTAAVERLLDEDKSLAQSKDDKGRTPLQLAIEGEQLSIVQLLMKHVAVDNFALAGGNSTLLHWAAARGFAETVNHLVANGADVSNKDADGRTPLQVAIVANQLLVADALVSEETIDQLPMPEGASRLHWACENGMIRTVAELIAAKEDIDAEDDDGQTALHIAAYNGDAPITKLLIEHKADANARGPSGQTPLHAAAEAGHTAVAALLLAAGADATPTDNSNYTPLHYAAWFNHPQTAMLLLHHGAKVDARTNDAETPLHKAAWRGHAKVALVLLAHGADREAKDNFDLTPTDKANSDIQRLTHKKDVAKLLAEE